MKKISRYGFILVLFKVELRRKTIIHSIEFFSFFKIKDLFYV